MDGTVLDGAILLQDYILRVTGAKLPIVSDKDIDDVNDLLILVGETSIGDQYSISSKDLEAEEYLVKTFERGIAITGNIDDKGKDTATLFGIYAFLGKTLGIRWYFPGEMGTVVPKQGSLSVSRKLHLEDVPKMEVHLGGISHWDKEIAWQWHPALRFGKSKGLVANHTHERWFQLYGNSQPELFGIRKDGKRAITSDRAKSGQNKSFLCYSEPAVLQKHIEIIDDYLETGNIDPWAGGVRPEGNNIPFGLNDTRKICYCTRCRSEVQPEKGRYGKRSNLVFNFISKLGIAVKRRHPEATIWVLAYDSYQIPPDKIKMLPDNIGVTLCLIPTVIQMNHPGVLKRNRDIIDAWYNILNKNRERLIIWDYFCYPNTWFIAPTEATLALKNHIQYTENKALGIFTNGFNPITKANEPKLYLTFRIVWIMHQLLWNPDLDLDKARERWCNDLFGPASVEMNAFYNLMEQRWRSVTWSKEPKNGALSSYNIYGETYPPDIINELEGLLNKASSRCKEGSIYKRRINWFKDKAFTPFFKESRSHSKVYRYITESLLRFAHYIMN